MSQETSRTLRRLSVAVFALSLAALAACSKVERESSMTIRLPAPKDAKAVSKAISRGALALPADTTIISGADYGILLLRIESVELADAQDPAASTLTSLEIPGGLLEVQVYAPPCDCSAEYSTKINFAIPDGIPVAVRIYIYISAYVGTQSPGFLTQLLYSRFDFDPAAPELNPSLGMFDWNATDGYVNNVYFPCLDYNMDSTCDLPPPGCATAGSCNGTVSGVISLNTAALNSAGCYSTATAGTIPAETSSVFAVDQATGVPMVQVAAWDTGSLTTCGYYECDGGAYDFQGLLPAGRPVNLFAFNNGDPINKAVLFDTDGTNNLIATLGVSGAEPFAVGSYSPTTSGVLPGVVGEDITINTCPLRGDVQVNFIERVPTPGAPATSPLTLGSCTYSSPTFSCTPGSLLAKSYARLIRARIGQCTNQGVGFSGLTGPSANCDGGSDGAMAFNIEIQNAMDASFATSTPSPFGLFSGLKAFPTLAIQALGGVLYPQSDIVVSDLADPNDPCNDSRFGGLPDCGYYGFSPTAGMGRFLSVGYYGTVCDTSNPASSSDCNYTLPAVDVANVGIVPNTNVLTGLPNGLVNQVDVTVTRANPPTACAFDGSGTGYSIYFEHPNMNEYYTVYYGSNAADVAVAYNDGGAQIQQSNTISCQSIPGGLRGSDTLTSDGVYWRCDFPTPLPTVAVGGTHSMTFTFRPASSSSMGPTWASKPVTLTCESIAPPSQDQQLIKINPTTGVWTRVGSAPFDPFRLALAPASCNKGVDTLYGVAYNPGPPAGYALVTINQATGALTYGPQLAVTYPPASLPANPYINALAVDPTDCALYAVDNEVTKNLIQIDTATGVGTILGLLQDVAVVAFNPVNIAFDASGNLFAVDGAQLASVNPGNGLENGTAQAVTTNTIVLAATASTINNFYNGDKIVITGGPGLGQITTITGYVGASQTATVSPAWATPFPDSTSTYSIYPVSLVTLVGAPYDPSAYSRGDGLTFSGSTLYYSGTGTMGTLDSLDTTTGAWTSGTITLTGPANACGIISLTQIGTSLYGIQGSGDCTNFFYGGGAL